MLKVTHPEGGAAAGSAVNSYMEKRGSWRVISKTWNCVLQAWEEEEAQGHFKVRRRSDCSSTSRSASYLDLPPTKALMCRSTGMSLGGTMGTLMHPDRL